MQRRKLFAVVLAGVPAGTGLAARGDSPNARKKNGATATVLNVGMPNRR